jgi:hypothetical protein
MNLLTVRLILKAELEHRKSKTHFLRTSCKSVPKQLSKIERRQRHIQRIRDRLNQPKQVEDHSQDEEDVINNPCEQYDIGKTQNFPVHLPTFIKDRSGDRGDPAIQVSACVNISSLLPS